MTPMMEQYRKLKQQNPKALLLFRLGDFYEFFYEDALIASSLLGVVLTRREARGVKVPMCGIPHHALERYVPKLLESGHPVAICEQLEPPSTKKKVVKRDVVRILTPGTAQDLGVGEEGDHQYVMGYVRSDRGYGVSFVDVGTGDVKLGFIREKEELRRLLFQLSPKEVILPAGSKQEDEAFLKSLGLYLQRWRDDRTVRALIKDAFSLSTHALGLDRFAEVHRALEMVLDYVQNMERTPCTHFGTIQWLEPEGTLLLDEATAQHLQVVPSAAFPKDQTLFGILDKTCTSMGRRLLKEWLLFPLLNPERIAERQKAVEEILSHFTIWEELSSQLAALYDLSRLASLLSLNRISPRQMAQLRNSLRLSMAVKEKLKAFSCPLLSELRQNIDVAEASAFLEKMLEEDPALKIEDGAVIKEGFDSSLDALRKKRKMLEQRLLEMEKKLREETGIKSLKVGFNQVFGYYIEVSKPNLPLVPKHFRRKQTMATAERFVTSDLLFLQQEMEQVLWQTEQTEQKLYEQMISEAKAFLPAVQRAAACLAELDVLGSLAKAALEYGYVKPDVTGNDEILLKECRHPILERLTDKGFVGNDVQLDRSECRVSLITGPNMSGKSTYLRQVALCVIMAQMGSFLPASFARIGIVDRIFSRVGAQDEITQGRSTFMVEMQETARLLRQLTPRSLLLLDEVGRGTGTYDGLSLAQAIVEYLCTIPAKPRVLFATHFLELTSLEKRFSGLKNYTILVKEKEARVFFMHKIIRGSADRSYGLYVAEMAGLPRKVIERAKAILQEKEKGKKVEYVQLTLPSEPFYEKKEQKESSVERKLKALDINRITPLEAINFLSALKEELNGDQS